MRLLIPLAVFAGIVFLLTGGHSSGNGGSISGPDRSVSLATHQRARRPVMHYDAGQRMVIDSMDIAAGKANLAISSPTGVFERRTVDEWCSAVLDAEQVIVRGHSLKWAARLDHATDS